MKEANTEEQTIQKLTNAIHFLKSIIKEIEQERRDGKKIKLWHGTRAYIDAALGSAKAHLKLAITEYNVNLQDIKNCKKSK